MDLDTAFPGSAEDLGGRDGEGEDVGAVSGVDGVGGEVLLGLEGGKGLVTWWMDGGSMMGTRIRYHFDLMSDFGEWVEDRWMDQRGCECVKSCHFVSC